MPIVSTGQITIVDNNDARPITAYITANPGPQQVFTKDESTVSYTPDWTAGAGLVLTAKVYIGGMAGAEDVTGQLTNRKWSTDLSTALTGTGAALSTAPTLDAIFDTGTFTAVHSGSTSTLTIDANMASTVAQGVIYFEGDYTDPVTGLVSHVVAQIVLGLVKTGTNAVYVVTRGQTAIEQATGATKTVAVVAADLMRAAGVDTSGVTYRFFEANGATQIYNAAPFNTKYGLKTTAFGTGPTGALGDIGVNLPASGAYGTHNTLVIHESAITDMMVFRVEARDADNVVYQTYFTVYDVSDPYQLNILSSTGDKLQNGIGSTVLTPEVYYGATKVASLTGWNFTWTFYNKDGKRGGFIDTTKTAVAGGRNITANTTGAAGNITYDGAAITWAAGQLVKVVNAAGSERFYEIASGTANNVVLRTPVTNTWLNYTDFPAPAVANDFVGGKLFAVVGNGGQLITAAAASVTLTGDEVDIKARITCEGNRP
ncbi:MAG: hypothetical protein EOR84_22690 [Mesorhizobium sp.]|uniref:hypothetical protein n=1 Tax=Mesorhizobium sp. TaxID=1871066 RepID=UPI000FE74750|nr:hypothetical protein [Mesorhizobium sp.]RWM90020.1 MAG: hypothetical protein EOR84_22690 [Mesorhizobium sp.]